MEKTLIITTERHPKSDSWRHQQRLIVNLVFCRRAAIAKKLQKSGWMAQHQFKRRRKKAGAHPALPASKKTWGGINTG